MKNLVKKMIIGAFALALLFGSVAYATQKSDDICKVSTTIGTGAVALAMVPAVGKRQVITRPTQLQKLLHTAKKFGTPADQQQFTERVIYDALPMDGRQVYNFFEGCSSRRFPFTNLSENKLQRGENMIVKFISLETITSANGTTVSSVDPVSATSSGIYRSDLNLQIGQSVVLKQFPLDGLNPSFNMYAKHTTANVVRLGVDLTLPEFLEFVARLQVSYTTTEANKYLLLKLHGEATIFSPRASF